MVQRVFRFLVVLAVGILATSVPGFGTFISLIGSLCCASLAFIVPALCHLVLHRNEMRWFGCSVDVFLIAFGAVGMFIGVTDSIRTLIEGLPGAEGMKASGAVGGP